MSSTSEVRLARSAGTRPTSTVATSAVAKAKSTTGRLMPVSSSRGMSAGLSATRVSSTAAARGDAEEPAGARDERAFGEQLADQDAAARAERGADGDFAAARCAAREHQARDVAARNQQDEHDRCHQQPQGLPRRPEDEVEQRRHDDAEVRHVDAKLVSDRLQIRRHLAPRVVDAHARLQSPQGIEHAQLAEQVGARLSGVAGDRLEPRRRRSSSTARRAGRRTPEASRRSLRRAVESLPRAASPSGR